jgi:hypothetical protein
MLRARVNLSGYYLLTNSSADFGELSRVARLTSELQGLSMRAICQKVIPRQINEHRGIFLPLSPSQRSTPAPSVKFLQLEPIISISG